MGSVANIHSQMDMTFYLEIQGKTDDVLFHQIYNGDPPTRIVHQTKNFAVLCDIAPLTLGHLIIIPNWPWISLGKVPSTLWEELLNLKDEVSSKLTKYYTKPIFVEHGSSQSMTTGGCVTHAHLHAVPCSLDLLPALAENQLDFKKIKTIHDLSKLGSKDVSYIFFENLSGDMYISETNKKIQRQFIRIEIGKSLGIEDPYWDWGVFVNKVLLKETVRALSQDIWETN